jgi:hypothetical protein
MGLWDKLRNARNYVRKRRGPDSYFQYKRKREDERKADAGVRDRATSHAEQERADAERGRGYAERYTADRERDTTGKRPEQAEETEPDT